MSPESTHETAALRQKVEDLRRQKTSHSREEMSRLAWERYTEIKEELEERHLVVFVIT